MRTALEAARSALSGERAWIVGGAVRDELLGLDVIDLDLAVDRDAKRAAQAIARALGAASFELSDAFGAWRVVPVDRSWQVDVVPLQGDSIESDLDKRDFTVNAMARPLAGDEVLDPFGGQADLRDRRLRMVRHDAFDADPLRVLRLVRFCVVLGLEPEPSTFDAARRKSPAIVSVAGERIFTELRSIIGCERVLDGLKLMDELGLTSHVLPELAGMRGVQQNRFHHLDVYDHTLEVLSNVLALQQGAPDVLGQELAETVRDLLDRPFSDDLSRGTALRMGALFHDCAKPQTQTFNHDGTVHGFPGHAEQGVAMAREALGRLRTSERLRAHVAALTRHHLRAGFLVHEERLERRLVHRYLMATGDVAVDVTLLSIADRLATRGRKAEDAIARHLEVARKLLLAALEREREGEPAALVRGDDLASALSIVPGPALGELLAEIAEARYAGEVETRDDALALARSILAGGAG